MSSSRFEAFSERGPAVAGESATQALADYLRTKGAGARLAPRRLAAKLDIDEDALADLIEVAVAVRLLEDASQVRCPHCDSRIDLSTIAERVAEDGVATCPDCERELEDLAELERDERYALSAGGAAEAETWQAEQDARPRMSAVVVCALVDELEQVHRQMAQTGKPGTRTVTGGERYYTTTFAGKHVDFDVYAVASEATNPSAAAAAVSAVLNLEPQIALLVGIAGGVEEKGAALGDVVAATVVHDYDIGKDTEDGFVARAMQHKSSFALKQIAGHLKIDDAWRGRILPADPDPTDAPPRVWIEPIAAGGHVVAARESTTYKLIRSVADRAVAVEMEGSGFLSALDRFAVAGMVVRGISDLVSEKGKTDAKGWQGQAAANAAAFAFELLYEFEPAP